MVDLDPTTVAWRFDALGMIPGVRMLILGNPLAGDLIALLMAEQDASLTAPGPHGDNARYMVRLNGLQGAARRLGLDLALVLGLSNGWDGADQGDESIPDFRDDRTAMLYLEGFWRGVAAYNSCVEAGLDIEDGCIERKNRAENQA